MRLGTNAVVITNGVDEPNLLTARRRRIAWGFDIFNRMSEERLKFDEPIAVAFDVDVQHK
jgi:hypothetical protein